MMQCDLDCMACDHQGTCTKPAAIEWRAEEAGEAPHEGVCADCTCHPTVARRLAELERDMVDIKTALFGLGAFFERLGEGESR